MKRLKLSAGPGWRSTARRLERVIERAVQRAVLKASCPRPAAAPIFADLPMLKSSAEVLALLQAPEPPAPKPSKAPAPIGAERKRRRILTQQEVDAAKPLFLALGVTKAAAKLGWPKQTLNSLATRMGWRDAPAVVAEPAAPAAPPPPAAAVAQKSARAIAAGAAAAALPRDPTIGRQIPTPPTPPAPMDPAQLEPVPASYEDALDWLYADLVRERMEPAEIDQRLVGLSQRQVFANCNARRVRQGLSPYAPTRRAA